MDQRATIERPAAGQPAADLSAGVVAAGGPNPTPDMVNALGSFVMMHRANALLMAHVAQQHGSNVSDLRALTYIGGGGDTTPGAIGRELGFSSGAITTLVDRLHAAEWAHRVPNPNDRRSSYLALLPAGQAVLEQVATIYATAFSAATSGDTTFDCLLRAFTSVGDALRDANTAN